VVGIVNDEVYFGDSCRSCDFVEEGGDVALSFDGGANSVSDCAKGCFQGGGEISWNEECEGKFVHSCRNSSVAHRYDFAGAMEVVIHVYFSLMVRLVFKREYLHVNVRIDAFVFERHGLHLCRFIDCDYKPTG